MSSYSGTTVYEILSIEEVLETEAGEEVVSLVMAPNRTIKYIAVHGTTRYPGDCFKIVVLEAVYLIYKTTRFFDKAHAQGALWREPEVSTSFSIYKDKGCWLTSGLCTVFDREGRCASKWRITFREF